MKKTQKVKNAKAPIMAFSLRIAQAKTRMVWVYLPTTTMGIPTAVWVKLRGYGKRWVRMLYIILSTLTCFVKFFCAGVQFAIFAYCHFLAFCRPFDTIALRLGAIAKGKATPKFYSRQWQRKKDNDTQTSGRNRNWDCTFCVSTNGGWFGYGRQVGDILFSTVVWIGATILICTRKANQTQKRKNEPLAKTNH